MKYLYSLQAAEDTNKRTEQRYDLQEQNMGIVDMPRLIRELFEAVCGLQMAIAELQQAVLRLQGERE